MNFDGVLTLSLYTDDGELGCSTNPNNRLYMYWVAKSAAKTSSLVFAPSTTAAFSVLFHS